MSFRNAMIVYRKELIDFLRDRRTIRSMIVVPLFIFPLVTIGMMYVSYHFISKAQREIPRIMIVGGEDSPGLMAKLRQFKQIDIVPAYGDYTTEILHKKIRAAVSVPPHFDDLLQRGDQIHVSIYYTREEISSQFAFDTLAKFFNELRDQTARSTLVKHNLPATFLESIVVDEKNLTPLELAAGAVLARLLPYLIIVVCLNGATGPAIDVTAGEKERGTMETILCSPVSRTDLVLGKFLLVFTASFTTALVAITSMSLCSIYAQKLVGVGGSSAALHPVVAVRATAAVFAMVLPLTVFFSAALLAIALLARTFREAGSYVSPVTMVVILAAGISFLPGIELNLKTSFIPILNTSLVSREILAGTYHWGFIVLVFATTCAYASAAMSYAVRLFNDEKVLFRA
jgi:sodium transport system permease protein